MDRESKADPATHQPTKAELEESVSIDATPEALAWATTRGGAARGANTQGYFKARDIVADGDS